MGDTTVVSCRAVASGLGARARAVANASGDEPGGSCQAQAGYVAVGDEAAYARHLGIRSEGPLANLGPCEPSDLEESILQIVGDPDESFWERQEALELIYRSGSRGCAGEASRLILQDGDAAFWLRDRAEGLLSSLARREHPVQQAELPPEPTESKCPEPPPGQPPERPKGLFQRLYEMDLNPTGF